MTALSNANVCLIFGTDTGTTEEIGDKICAEFANVGCAVEMINVTDVSLDQLNKYDFIIMGIPTWDFGGIQDDWEELESEISTLNLQGKTIALYGLGDQLGYGHYFVDAMGWLYENLSKSQARFIGAWSTEGYFYEESRAVNSDRTMFCGLAIDDDQQFDLTDERVASWVMQLVGEYEKTNAA